MGLMVMTKLPLIKTTRFNLQNPTYGKPWVIDSFHLVTHQKFLKNNFARPKTTNIVTSCVTIHRSWLSTSTLKHFFTFQCLLPRTILLSISCFMGHLVIHRSTSNKLQISLMLDSLTHDPTYRLQSILRDGSLSIYYPTLGNSSSS